jgi:methionyl-tRNA formyltransferase
MLVITKPSTVKEMTSIAKGACVYSVNSQADLDELILAQPFDTKLGVLIDFGVIVSQKVIDSFELGIINSHFSLLPEWRGADPITFSVLSGQRKTGVSLMVLVAAMDEGPVIACGLQELDGKETTPELTDKLIFLSDGLLKKQLPRYIAGGSSGIEQDKLTTLIPDYPSKPSYSRKLTKGDGVLDFTKPAVQLEREVRAYMDWPKSTMRIAEKDVVVLEASVDATAKGDPGTVFRTSDKKVGVYCSEGALIIAKLKPAGKQAMSSEGFLAGYGQSIPLKN